MDKTDGMRWTEIDLTTPSPQKPGEVDLPLDIDMPNPSRDDLSNPIFEAIWQVIKTWDINSPEYYSGYCGANGSHAKILLDSVLATGRLNAVAQKPGEVDGLKREVCTTFDKVEGSKYGFEYGSIEWTIDHLAATGHLNPVREGWKLVPIEPTDKMIQAGVQAGVNATPKPWCPETWKAMLDAAPELTRKD